MLTRILSDVHFGHPASFVRDARQLAPLLDGVPRMIFNGDSVEMRFLDEREQAARDIASLRRICEQEGTEPVFINGNHDPALSTLNHVELAEGAVLVTHGDVLFHGMSPWSREATILRKAHARELEALNDPGDLDLRLRAVKSAALAIERLGPESRASGLTMTVGGIFRQIWPPWRPLKIVNCWLRTPGRADALACEYRPQARFVVIGHVHWAGIWRIGGRVVLNTGSFLPFSQRLAVDIDPEAGEVIVRKIISRNDLFRLGETVRRFPLG